MTAADKENGGKQAKINSLVLYPRRYVCEGDDHRKHYVEGVDRAGRPCRGFLRITPQARGLAQSKKMSLPSMALLSDTRITAQNPCRASEGNGRESPNGVLLLEQCELVDKEKREYSAGWASVLRRQEDPSQPLPMFGHGYVEMRQFLGRNGKDDKDLQELLRRAGEPGLNDDERAALCADIYPKIKLAFSALFLSYPDAMPMRSLSEVREFAVHCMEMGTSLGGSGGALVRVRRGQTVSALQSRLIERQYGFREKRMLSTGECWRMQSGDWRDADRLFATCEVDCIPTLRVNCGPQGNQRYGRDAALSESAPKIEKIWLEREFRRRPSLKPPKFPHLATRLAVRTAYTKEGNCIVSAAHVCGMPIGNALSLDKALVRRYTVRRP